MSKFRDLKGQVFGRLLVLESDGRDKWKRVMWKCKCECGTIKTISSRHLIQGNTRSCGCLRSELVREQETTHGLSEKYARLINVWYAMVSRCHNPDDSNYKNYGGRGIEVCEEWRYDYLPFHNWALQNGYDINAIRGECTIDRIDNDGNYEPSNCRWVSNTIQANNKSNNSYYTVNGITNTLAHWCREYNLPYSRVMGRLGLGWTIEEALELVKK